MLAYSYKRFSSKQQEKGDSIRRQTQLAEDYCRHNKLTLSSDTFNDLGVSAFRSDNSKEDSGLGQFMNGLTEGKVSTPCYLLVESLDRLSRANFKAAMMQLWNIVERDVTVITLGDGKSYTKAMDFTDFLVAGVIIQRANEESETKSKRLQAVWENRRTNPDAKKTKNCPFWLKLDRRKNEYVPNDKVALVYTMYSMAVSGVGNTVIAKHLNSEGHKSPTGKSWTTATISATLRNRSVLGEYQPKKRYDNDGNRVDAPIGEPIKGYYPRIIDDALFYDAQAAIQARDKFKRAGATRSHLNVVREIAICGSCGSPMRLLKQVDTVNLVCTSFMVGTCEHKRINLRFVEAWLCEFWLTEEYAPQSMPNLKEAAEVRKLKARLKEAEEVTKRLSKAYAMTEDDQVLADLQDAASNKKQIKLAISKAEEELAPFMISKRISAKRHTLVKTAFMEGNALEQITARCELAQLLLQLKSFSIVMTKEEQVSLKVTRSDGVIKEYIAVKRPFHKRSAPLTQIFTEL